MFSVFSASSPLRLECLPLQPSALQSSSPGPPFPWVSSPFCCESFLAASEHSNTGKYGTDTSLTQQGGDTDGMTRTPQSESSPGLDTRSFQKNVTFLRSFIKNAWFFAFFYILYKEHCVLCILLSFFFIKERCIFCVLFCSL